MTASAILVTGMSGVGKTSALRALAARGYNTVETDEGDWIEVVEGEPLWREDRMTALLDRPRTAALFVQGTVANQGRLYERFDAVVLLSAPLDVMIQRVTSRPVGQYGTSAADRIKIARDMAEVEPILRRGATHRLDATLPLASVVDRLIEIEGSTG